MAAHPPCPARPLFSKIEADMTARNRSSVGGARAVLGLGLVVALSIAAFLAPASACAEGCPLASRLILSDTQDGFAGQVGTVWTIAPDCSFSVARQLGDKVSDPFRQGRLTPQQRTSFETLVSQAAIADLPAQLGEGPPVNARRVTLTYEDKVTVLMLPPGDLDLATLAATLTNEPARRLVALADGVKRMTGE